MDVPFELSKRLNELHLKAALKRQNPETHFICFNEKKPFDLSTHLVPFLENIAFVLALFNHKTTESFAQGEKLLTTLLSYQKGGHFPKYLHEAPDISSSYTAVYAYPYLYIMEKNFTPFLNKELKKKVHDCLLTIQEALFAITIYPHLEPLAQVMRHIALEYVEPTFESALAYALSSDKSIKVGVYNTSCLEEGHLKLTLWDFIKAQVEGFYTPDLLEDHPLHLKLALFYEPFNKSKVPLSIVFEKNYEKGLFWKTPEGRDRVFSFDDRVLSFLKKGGNSSMIEGNLELHQELILYFPYQMSAFQFDKKGTRFLAEEPIYLKEGGMSLKIRCNRALNLIYKKRPHELFEALSLCLVIQTKGPYRVELSLSHLLV